jgi:ATPase subunit of ABC transporter with duplicated ATPase domains
VLSRRLQEQPSNTIASELVVRFGNQVVLDHASVSILEGERIGLVGHNGSGKSTFLQIAAGVMRPDAGELNRRRDLVVGYMPQMFELACARGPTVRWQSRLRR